MVELFQQDLLLSWKSVLSPALFFLCVLLCNEIFVFMYVVTGTDRVYVCTDAVVTPNG